jgi:hypothetical protein
MFRKGIGFCCPVDCLEYEENGETKKLDCFFTNGPNTGESKGLFVLYQELGLIKNDLIPKNIKLKT